MICFPGSLRRFGFSFALQYLGSTYYYKKNAQNDIIAILDICGNVVVQYKYDAWGNHKVLGSSGATISNTSHIGHLNPFRYRSYFYDTETGLYYLKSRYYDPKLGRFISPDDISYLDPNTVNGLNLYAYCNNNPVMYYDPTGHFVLAAALISIGIGAILGGIYGGVSAAANDQSVFKGVVVGSVVGGLTGLVTYATSGITMLALNFAIGASGDIATQIILDNKNWADVNLVSAMVAGVANATLSIISKDFSNIIDKAGLELIGNYTKGQLVGNIISNILLNSPLSLLSMAFI